MAAAGEPTERGTRTDSLKADRCWGFFRPRRIKTSSVSASEGDLLVLFSDGITEAPNRRDEQFGDDRLIAVVQQTRELPAQAICEAILASVRTFAGDRPAPDDQTLLVVRLWRAGR